MGRECSVENGHKRHAKSLFSIKSDLPLFPTGINWGQTVHAHSQPIGGYRRAQLELYEASLTEQLSLPPSITLKEMLAWLADEQGLPIFISTIDKFVCHKRGYRYKKRRAGEQKREDVAAMRVQSPISGDARLSLSTTVTTMSSSIHRLGWISNRMVLIIRN